jgi:hypothetical protein
MGNGGLAPVNGHQILSNALKEACGVDILAPGFPAEMSDDEVEEAGYEIIPKA